MEQELVDATTAELWLKALDATKALEPFAQRRQPAREAPGGLATRLRAIERRRRST